MYKAIQLENAISKDLMLLACLSQPFGLSSRLFRPSPPSPGLPAVAYRRNFAAKVSS